MPQDIMKKLLLICTTKTPFHMCELENKIFDVYPNSKPLFYVRYVDDILFNSR